MKNTLLITMLVLTSLVGRSQCQADFTAAVTNGTVDFTNTSLGNSLSYYWNFGDGFSSNLQNPTHTYTTVGNYTACLSIYSSDSLCQDVFCDSVNILTVDTLSGGCVTSFIYTTSSQSISCTNTTTSNGNFIYAYWDIYDVTNTNVYSAGTSNIVYFPTVSGTYNVCLTTYDSLQNACGTVCELVYFNNDSLDSNLGYFLNKLSFNVYPNPAHDLIIIEMENSEQCQAMLLDTYGRKLTTVDLMYGKAQMDLSNFTEGMYILTIINEHGKMISTRKILKE